MNAKSSKVSNRDHFRMENIIGVFCDSKDYKLVSRKLAKSESQSDLEQFIQFIEKRRNKRRFAALSFEVTRTL